jgi:hypothetical protein
MSYDIKFQKHIPLSNLKSYTKGSPEVVDKYLLIVPPKNRMKTTVVAIHIGP